MVVVSNFAYMFVGFNEIYAKHELALFQIMSKYFSKICFASFVGVELTFKKVVFGQYCILFWSTLSNKYK